MKALRLILHQNSANYKKEETLENKMTYPLPPVSTIIGALHNICGYREYKEMNISIQGKYESMHRKPYTDHCFQNSVCDDRGILIKMANPSLLSGAFVEVAAAKKQGSSFMKGNDIQVFNRELLEEYRSLKKMHAEIDAFKKTRLKRVTDLIAKRKKHLAEKKKKLQKKTPEYEQVEKREKEIKKLEKEIKARLDEYQRDHYTIPFSQYRTLTKSLKFYEVLDGVTLVLHVHAADEVLEDILEHIYDLRSIGRSEDTVSVENAEIVELQEDTEEDEIESSYSAYIDCDMIKNRQVYARKKDGGNKGAINGTKYYLNKNYEIVDGKRVFHKKKALYVSQYAAEEFGNGLYLDSYGQETFIVNFL